MLQERKPAFLLADNLNRIARYLRMLGYDASIYRSISFSNRIRLCRKERRIYLTRSSKEAKSKIKFSRFLIRSDRVIDQLIELKKMLTYSEDYLFTRCIECNKLVYPITKEKIQDLIPTFAYENHNSFHLCRKCGRIYWQGTHYHSMKDQLANLFLNK